MASDNLQQERLKKLENIKNLGINPYPAKSQREHTIAQAREMLDSSVSVVGRIKSLRPHGKISFIDLEDFTGKIQLFFSESDLGEEKYQFLSNLDIGDFLGVGGTIFKTQAGELSVKVEKFDLLTKSIRPIPSEYFGLKDIETRLRKRHLDLLSNPEVKELFVKKAKFWTAVRLFLIEQGFLEVETPVLEPIPGGADARPFITHHNALNRDLFLRISLELYQKRLLVGGFEKVFEIGRVFRNEGIDAQHLQDYTQMEFYWAYANYHDLMDITEKMFKYLVEKTMGTLTTNYEGNEIDWSKDFEKLDYGEVFLKATGIDLDQNLTEDELREYATKNNIPVEKKAGLGRLIDSIYKKKVRVNIIQPTFLINHPVVVSPLAKRMESNPNRVERVQLLAGGAELCNAYSELNDPIDQMNRFKDQQVMKDSGDEEAQMMDLDFVEALEYGMPPAAGFGMSERVFSFLVDKPIRETVFFPSMKEE